MSTACAKAEVAILCGGFGTRLGGLTARTPKPLLPVKGRPFLDHLLMEIGRFGFRHILLLAHFEYQQIEAFARSSAAAARFGLELEVSVEPEPAGTGGALHHARDRLADRFILMNGDTWLDTNYHRLLAQLDLTGADAAMSLREVSESGRFHAVELQEGLICSFKRHRGGSAVELVNGGVVACTRNVLGRVPERGSIEELVWPALAIERRLAGTPSSGFFLDIGVPEAFARAQEQVPAQHWRGAVFFDRDGVLNVDHGHVGTVDRFEWNGDAREAVRLVNENGLYAFVVTNQAGVAKGFYAESDVDALHAHMQFELNLAGAHIDSFRYSPFHPQGTLVEYARDTECRKPGPGMILELLRDWPVKPDQSFLVGDKDSDLAAASAAGIRGLKYDGGSLKALVQTAIQA